MVEMLTIRGIQLMHGFRQVGMNRFHQQVVVVRHQTKGMYLKLVFVDGFSQSVEPNQVISPVMINGSATIPT
ncbi:hypothetical protein ASD58_27845 [Duganella sp. Root1480D1]|nr:hypothetical protein ASD58_27845 [Duganella sp. Root1480D1]